MQISDGPTTPQTRRVLKNKRVNSGSFNSVLCPGMQSELTTYFCTHLLGIEADIHELFLVLCSMLFHHHNGGGGGGGISKKPGSGLLVKVDLWLSPGPPSPPPLGKLHPKQQWGCHHKGW